MGINSVEHVKKTEVKRGGNNTVNHEKLLKKCLILLSSNGFFTWKNSSGAVKGYNGRFQRYGLIGSGDIIGMCPSGRFVCFECKTGKAVQNKHQKTFEKAVKARDGIYIVIHSLEELKEWLATYL